MTSYNYRALRQKRKPKVVDHRSELPPGNWVSVTEAAKAKNYSPMTIRFRFLKGKCDGFVVCINGKLLVNLDQIN